MLLFLTTLNSANLALAHQRERIGDLTLRKVLGAGRAVVVRVTLLKFLPILVIMSVIAAALAVYCIDLSHAYPLPSPYMPFEIRFRRAAILYLVGTGLMVMLCVTASAVAVSVLARPSGSDLHELAQRQPHVPRDRTGDGGGANCDRADSDHLRRASEPEPDRPVEATAAIQEAAPRRHNRDVAEKDTH